MVQALEVYIILIFAIFTAVFAVILFAQLYNFPS